ncbi:MAG TPA: hypothetical protein VFQ60_02915 [Patescibacteria group bacterium]|nr:hypothetical protein [Patescibacteria group bacterium]
MKGCLLLQRQFAYIGHFVAAHLKAHYGITEFCGYVFLRSSLQFLTTQTEITYTRLLLDEEIHARYKTEPLDPEYLRFLEREYGLPSLWPYLTVDRIVFSSQLVREYPFDAPRYTHEEMLRLLQVYARAIIEMLDTEKPDFLFCSALGGIGSLLLYHIAKKRGIKILHVLPSCLKDRYVLSEQYNRFTWADTLFQNEPDRLRASESWNQAAAYLNEFRAKPIPYVAKLNPAAQSVTRSKQLMFLKPKNAIRSITAFVKLLKDFYTKPDRHDYDTVHPWHYLIDRIKRKLNNLRGTDDLYDTFNPDEPFVFFPLHYEPEISLLLLAPFRTDQLSLIKQIARALPVQYKLYVKDHPQMAEYRPRRFYKALKKIPNIKLIRPSMKSFEILPRAKLIATITGTAGWEAIMLGKPVISFGHWFYNSLPQVAYCRAIEDLPQLVKERLDHFTCNDDELLLFMAALFHESAEVSLNYLWEDEPDLNKKREGVRPLADLVAKKLNIKPLNQPTYVRE